REYSIQGRWASPDPAGLSAVDPTNPQSWDRYAYVTNSPLALVDPSGLSPQAFTPQPCGDQGCGTCTMDDITVSCNLAISSLTSGAAGVCPNNDCTGIFGLSQNGNFIGWIYAPAGIKGNCQGPSGGNPMQSCSWSVSYAYSSGTVAQVDSDDTYIRQLGAGVVKI